MYSTLVTARRREEIYPPHVKWLAYDSDNNLVAYLGNDGQPVELEGEDMSIESVIKSLQDLVAERDELRKQLEQKRTEVYTSNMEKRVMCSFSIRGDDPEYVYGLYSRKHAETMIKENEAKYGPGSISDVQIQEYHIVWKN